jgi:hypothetical protein
MNQAANRSKFKSSTTGSFFAADGMGGQLWPSIPPAVRLGIRACEQFWPQGLKNGGLLAYPGGCFLATVAAQLAPHPGRARDRVMKLQGEWFEQFIQAQRQACDDGELQPDADLESAGFRDHSDDVSCKLHLDRDRRRACP